MWAFIISRIPLLILVFSGEIQEFRGLDQVGLGQGFWWGPSKVESFAWGCCKVFPYSVEQTVRPYPAFAPPVKGIFLSEVFV